MLGFNDTSILVSHFVSSPKKGRKETEEIDEMKEWDREERKRKESEESEEITRGPRATTRSPE